MKRILKNLFIWFSGFAWFRNLLGGVWYYNRYRLNTREYKWKWERQFYENLPGNRVVTQKKFWLNKKYNK